MKVTGNRVVDIFLKELDRRIDSPDSPHDDASKERLRKMRIGLSILAASDPGRLEDAFSDSYLKVMGRDL